MSGVVESLPDRALTMTEVAALNDADAFDLVVPMEEEEAVSTEDMEEGTVCEAFVVASGSRVRGLVFEDGWRVVESVSTEGEEDRTDAMLACEAAIEDAVMPGERAN